MFCLPFFLIRWKLWPSELFCLCLFQMHLSPADNHKLYSVENPNSYIFHKFLNVGIRILTR
jgi:hypothetical protein